MRYDGDYIVDDDSASSWASSLIFYGLALAAVLKLLKANRWAEASAYSVLLVFPVILMYLGLPFGIMFGVMRLLGVGTIFSSVVATCAAIAVCKYILMPHFHFDSVDSAFKQLKWYLTNKEQASYKYDVNYQFNLLVKSIEYKFLYVLGTGGFLVLLFFLCRDYQLLNHAYYIYDYRLGWWKYLLLLGAWFACLLLYSKYYDFTVRCNFKNLNEAILAIQSKEGKLAVLTSDSLSTPHLRVAEEDMNDWSLFDEDDPRLVMFIQSEDGDKIGYVLNGLMSIGYFEYLIKSFNQYRGLEAYKDSILSK